MLCTLASGSIIASCQSEFPVDAPTGTLQEPADAGAAPSQSDSGVSHIYTVDAGGSLVGLDSGTCLNPYQDSGAGRECDFDNSDAGMIRLPNDAGVVEMPANREICNGIDDDDNGLVDDADIEGDGVCDCLKIGSIGRGGAASNGVLVFQSWPNDRAQNPVVSLGDQELTDALLEPFDVLIVLNVATVPIIPGDASFTTHAAFTDAEVAVFERFVARGGGVLTTAGYCVDQAQEVVNVNRLLEPFGLGYSTTKLELNGMVETWQAHPITAGLHKIFTDDGVEPEGTMGLTLGTDAAGKVALQVSSTDLARIIVWGDEWITYTSQWQTQAEQQVERFWLNSLAWLSPHSCQRPVTD